MRQVTSIETGLMTEEEIAKRLADLEASIQALVMMLKPLGVGARSIVSPTGDEHLLQDLEEFRSFCQLMADEGVRSYLEIGAWSGGSIEAAAKFLPAPSRIVAVEQPLPPYALFHHAKRARLNQVLKTLADGGYRTSLVTGDSTDRDTIKKVNSLGPYDALFIDGSHEFAAVASDFYNYSPMARLVGFHDIAADEPGHGVAEFWKLLKPSFKHVEFISEATRKRSEGGYGIGVIWRG